MAAHKHAALLIPHTDRTLETDLQASVPGLIVHTQRMWLEDVSGEAERRMVQEELPGSLAYLLPAGPYDCAVFGCTSASVSNGREGMERIEAQVSETLHCPALSAFGAVLRQIRAANAHRIAILTPYTGEVNAFFRAAMEQFGVSVTAIAGMGLLKDPEIAATTPGHILRFARAQAETLSRDAELCFVSCTNLRAAEIRGELSAALGIPVITTNQCIADYLKSLP